VAMSDQFPDIKGHIFSLDFYKSKFKEWDAIDFSKCVCHLEVRAIYAHRMLWPENSPETSRIYIGKCPCKIHPEKPDKD